MKRIDIDLELSEKFKTSVCMSEYNIYKLENILNQVMGFIKTKLQSLNLESNAVSLQQYVKEPS